MAWIYDIATALALLTRLPVRARFDRSARAAWAWPVVGLLVGFIAASVAWLGMIAGLPVAVAAGLALATQVVVTGAMHEDGLADCADGFWGGFDPARRLAIMRDSHLGAYGAIALILALGLRWTAFAAILGSPNWAGALIGAAILSRAAMLGVATTLRHARDDGLSVSTGRPPRAALWIGLILCLPVVLLCGIGAAIAAVAVGLGCGAIARAKIGGQTGDVLGATQQIAEIATLLILASTVT